MGFHGKLTCFSEDVACSHSGKGGNVASVKEMVMRRRGGVKNEGLILSMSHRRKDDEGGLPCHWRGDLPSKV